jgi:enoyl-[acyl-carrier protein] reductase III
MIPAEHLSSDRPFEGQVVVITGASRGIGRATAVRFAQGGASIVVNYLRHRSAADDTVAELTALGARALPVRADVSDPEDLDRLFAETQSAFGGLDVLVSNAALAVLRPALELEIKHWQKTLDVMGRALLLTAQRAVPLMAGRWGRIVSISSVGSFRVLPNYVAAGVAKSILETLTRYLAVELGPRGINVNAVSGGVIETDALKAFSNKGDMLYAGSQAPLGRMGEPDDLASVVTLLCRPEARWITGQTIIADGGYTLLGFDRPNPAHLAPTLDG